MALAIFSKIFAGKIEIITRSIPNKKLNLLKIFNIKYTFSLCPMCVKISSKL